MARSNRSIVFSFPLRFLSIFGFALICQVMSGVRANTETSEALKDLARRACSIYDIIDELSKLMELTPKKPQESHKNLTENLDKNDFTDLEPLVMTLVGDLKAVQHQVIDEAVIEIHNVNDTNLKKQIQEKVSALYKEYPNMIILNKKYDELKKSYPPKPTPDANDQNATEPEMSPSTSKSDDEGRSSTPMAEAGGQDQNVTEAEELTSMMKQGDQHKSTTAKPEPEKSNKTDAEPENRQNITTASPSAKTDDKSKNTVPKIKTKTDEKNKKGAAIPEASSSTSKPEEESDKREDNTPKDDENNSNRSGLFPFLDWLKAVIRNTKSRIRSLGKTLKVNEDTTTLRQVTSTTVRTTELTTTTMAPIKKEKGKKKKSSKNVFGPIRSWVSSFL